NPSGLSAHRRAFNHLPEQLRQLGGVYRHSSLVSSGHLGLAGGLAPRSRCAWRLVLRRPSGGKSDRPARWSMSTATQPYTTVTTTTVISASRGRLRLRRGAPRRLSMIARLIVPSPARDRFSQCRPKPTGVML